MELILSPGRLGGDNNTGSPFQNQEVREWSHVDRLTGMLEHARIETGRWQTRHQGTAQAYGKVIDSRERNSADGNVVQKARRQVEVFQSQGIGGRSVQVVRASQWSSSRITDSTSSSPVSVSMNDVAQLRNGNEELTAAAKPVNGRLCSDESLAKLSQVSRLCRQINAETASGGITRRTNLQTNAKAIPAQSPLMSNRFKKFDGLDVGKEEQSNRLNSSSLIMNSMKSTSNEDLTKSTDSNAKSHTTFARDCKARRSLQIPKSVVSDFTGNRNSEMRSDPEGTEFVEQNNSSRNSPSSDHDVLRNDRKIVKSYVLGMEEGDSEAMSSSSSLPKPILEKKIFFNGAVVDEIGKDNLIKSEYLRPTPILLKPKSNTTVVHLNNKLFLDSQKNGSAEHEQISSIVADKPIRTVVENDATIRAIAATSRVQSLASRFSNGNSNFKSINGKVESVVSQNSFTIKKQSSIDSSSRIESLISRSGVINGGGKFESLEVFPALADKKAVDEPSEGNPLGKPVKKVGFCKTEVHFAAESGKVNIVETDAKPPPSNRFRRRRRNSVALGGPVIGKNKNLPLIHFGDTSYEKYIFGQSVNGAFKNDDFGGKSKPDSEDTEDGDLTVREKTEQKLTTASDELMVKDGWRARLKTIMQSEPPIITEENDDLNDLGKSFDPVDETTIVDHSFKGSHTTTVNLGANVISKIQKHTNEGKCNTISTGLELQFNTRLQKLRANSSTTSNIAAIEVAKSDPAKCLLYVGKTPTPCSVVLSTTTASKIPRPLIQTQQSVLKSAHLVMNLNRINNLNSMMKSAGKNDHSNSNNGGNNEDSFTLKHLFYSLKDNRAGVLNMHGKESDADIANNNHPVKNASTLITISASNSSTSYKNLINNGSAYPARFTPLRLKHFNDRLMSRSEERKRAEESSPDSKENQLQYSSGSEQADEEVRSYMLGSSIQQSYHQHKKYSHSRSIETDQTARNFPKSMEQHLTSSAANHTRDIDHSIDNTERNHMADDELENIIDSGLLPVEEICFEANRTVEKSHLTEKLVNESNVVTSDNENNKVLLNIVTTHEPVVARVEDHSPETRLFASKKLRGHISVAEREEKDKIRRETRRSDNNKSFSSSVVKKTTSVKDNAKDHCDNKSGKDQVAMGLNEDTNTAVDPTYVNVFENPKKSAPIYENYRVTRKNNLNDRKHSRNGVLQPEVDATQKSANGNCDTETNVLPITNCEEESFKGYSKPKESEAKLATISESSSSKRNNRESHKVKPSKTRSKKIARPPSSASSIESIHRNSASETANKDSDARPLHTKSTRSSRLHRVTNAQEPSAKERYSSNENKKNTTERTSTAKVPRSNHTRDKITPTIKTEQGLESSNDSTRSKKPIEIVYQTAVFNMKNEKLAKSSRSKESKTAPRYINDLICGSKPKRSTDARHVKGTAMSQRVHHKSASPTNRHWK